MTKPLTKIRTVHTAPGAINERGEFQPADDWERLVLSGDEKKDHLHLTQHPPLKKPTSVLNGPGGRTHIPRFSLTSITRLEQVVIHSLGQPTHYAIEKPRTPYHALINAPSGTRPLLTFWVAPIVRGNETIPNDCVRENCAAYVRVSPAALEIDLLLQVEVTFAPSEGASHAMLVPVCIGPL